MIGNERLVMYFRLQMTYDGFTRLRIKPISDHQWLPAGSIRTG